MVRRSKRGEGNFDNRKIEKKYKYRCKGLLFLFAVMYFKIKENI